MFRQRERILSGFVFVLDLILTALAFLVAYWIRDALHTYFPLGRINVFLEFHMKLLLIIIPFWSLLFLLTKLYESFKTKTFFQEAFAVFKVVSIGSFIIVFGVFTLRYFMISRTVLALFWLLNLLFLVGERVAMRRVVKYRRSKGWGLLNIIVVGTGREAEEIAEVIDQQRHWNLRLVGFVSADGKRHKEVVKGYPVLGGRTDFPQIISDNVVDEVIFAVPRQSIERLGELFLLCEEEGIKTRVVLNLFPHLFSKVFLERLQDIPLLTFSTTPTNELALFVKRLTDIVVSSVCLIVLSPLFLIVSLLIKLTSEGPVLFKQARSGLYYRIFTMYKFRTMVVDAEERKRDVRYLNEMDGPIFKIRNDPRITGIGKWLRKTSIDELPQLINVLKGEMSLVGPRPHPVEEVREYTSWQRRRLSMKPGITGLWQVGGRSDTTFAKSMKHDLNYIDNWSLWLDIKVLMKTFPAALLGKGAS
jgi:exopolysaccharide biosynthesis polyprenyl glycosylphosphotransferase